MNTINTTITNKYENTKSQTTILSSLLRKLRKSDSLSYQTVKELAESAIKKIGYNDKQAKLTAEIFAKKYAKKC